MYPDWLIFLSVLCGVVSFIRMHSQPTLLAPHSLFTHSIAYGNACLDFTEGHPCACLCVLRYLNACLGFGFEDSGKLVLRTQVR